MNDVTLTEGISEKTESFRPSVEVGEDKNGFVGPTLPSAHELELGESHDGAKSPGKVQVIDIASSDEEKSSEGQVVEVIPIDSEDAGQNELEYKFQQSREVFKIETPFSKEKFLKGCKWSCKGDKFLTCGMNRSLYLFELEDSIKEKMKDESSTEPEEIEPLKVFLEGGLIYDYAWNPNPSKSDSFVCACAGRPAHLYSAKTGDILATYIGYDYAFEVSAPSSVAFSWQGDRVFCGYNGEVKRFHTEVPSVSTSFNLRSFIGPRAIVSCLASNPAFEELWAAGSYNGYVGLFNERGANVSLFVPKLGVTHITFSRDGSKLFTGFRKSGEILCWDLRQTGRVLFSMNRVSETSQRIYFDLTPNDRYLISGSRDCSVKVWDLEEAISNHTGSEIGLKPKYDFVAHSACVNGVGVHPSLPLLLTSTGEREFVELLSDEEDDQLFVRKRSTSQGSLSLWQIGV